MRLPGRDSSFWRYVVNGAPITLLYSGLSSLLALYFESKLLVSQIAYVPIFFIAFLTHEFGFFRSRGSTVWELAMFAGVQLTSFFLISLVIVEAFARLGSPVTASLSPSSSHGRASTIFSCGCLYFGGGRRMGRNANLIRIRDTGLAGYGQHRSSDSLRSLSNPSLRASLVRFRIFAILISVPFKSHADKKAYSQNRRHYSKNTIIAHPANQIISVDILPPKFSVNLFQQVKSATPNSTQSRALDVKSPIGSLK